MIRRNVVSAVLIASIGATSVVAQVQPQPIGGDAHLQEVSYDAGAVVQLRGAAGYQLMLELSADERVESVGVGDSSAWQVNVSKAGDRLFLKPLAPGVVTNMTVVTSIRVYNFDLQSMTGPTSDMPYTVVFHYPAPPPRVAAADGYVNVAAITLRTSRYKLSGSRELWPTSVTNDGAHTFISWPRSASIPAVYAQDEHGQDMLVNGMMRTDDVYVVDGVPNRLMFRIDDAEARATRLLPRSKGR